jgi:hypothetical protein
MDRRQVRAKLVVELAFDPGAASSPLALRQSL